MPGAEPCEIQALDGYRLGATLFRPAAGNGRALQINAAAGVKQEYYGKFAAYLAERGFSVLTFDYRGIGRSGSFRLKNARMRDWAELDAAAALGFLAQTKKRLVPQSRLPRRRPWRKRAVRALQRAASPVLDGRRPVCPACRGAGVAAALSPRALGAEARRAARARRRADRPLRLFPRAVPRYLVARCRRLAGEALNENARGQGRRRHRGGERDRTRHGARLCRRRHACRTRGRG